MTTFDTHTGLIQGEIKQSQKTLSDLVGVFANEQARAEMDQETVVYRVQMHDAEKEGVQGGLLFGTSFVEPGQVAGEYFMTRGHYHAKRATAEYYFCIGGSGALILMNEQGDTWFEKMCPGTLHYIPQNVAHRLSNTGEQTLVVGCCWPADAGHDYKTIAEQGFSKRLFAIDGKAVLA